MVLTSGASATKGAYGIYAVCGEISRMLYEAALSEILAGNAGSPRMDRVPDRRSCAGKPWGRTMQKMRSGTTKAVPLCILSRHKKWHRRHIHR